MISGRLRSQAVERRISAVRVMRSQSHGDWGSKDSSGTFFQSNRGRNCCTARPKKPEAATKARQNQSTCSSRPPSEKLAWNRMKGMQSVPSQRCPLSQKLALPMRRCRSGRRAPSIPAKNIMSVPMMPKINPGTLPPDRPLGDAALQMNHAAAPMVSVRPESRAQRE